MIQTTFSSINRMYGENISTIRFQKMIKEVALKVSLYNYLERWWKQGENNFILNSYATGIILI